VTALRGALCSLAFDMFAHQTMLVDIPPWQPFIDAADFQPRPWTEQDDLAATHWLQTKEAIAVTPAVTAQAVELVARDHAYHPVQDYLLGLEHDGKARLDTLLSQYFGAEQSEYTKLVGRNLMISAIARILGVGEKVDMMMILEGKQGLLKSTAIKTLFYPWFTDDIEQFGSKDASMQCAGVWCIEVGELDAMTKTEASRIKAFISRTDDRFRPPYGRRIIERPRSCIFIGTTNCNDYLKDWTGARRFLPVAVTQIDIEGLQRDRDMLWAEARILYEAGVPWWFTDNETGKAAAAKANDEQEARFQADPWEPLIIDYLDSRLHQPPDYPAYRVTIERVFKEAIQLDEAKRDQTAMNRVSRCMKRLGWERKQVTVKITVQGEPESKRVWMYVRPPTGEEAKQDARQVEIDAAKKASEAEPDSNVTTFKRPTPVAADVVVMQETAAPQA
jgi:predicted P-loop ATPase